MQYEVTITIDIDPDSNYFGSDTTFYLEDLEDLIRAVLYDVDDTEIIEINIKEVS